MDFCWTECTQDGDVFTGTPQSVRALRPSLFLNPHKRNGSQTSKNLTNASQYQHTDQTGLPLKAGVAPKVLELFRFPNVLGTG